MRIYLYSIWRTVSSTFGNSINVSTISDCLKNKSNISTSLKFTVPYFSQLLYGNQNFIIKSGKNKNLHWSCYSHYKNIFSHPSNYNQSFSNIKNSGKLSLFNSYKPKLHIKLPSESYVQVNFFSARKDHINPLKSTISSLQAKKRGTKKKKKSVEDNKEEEWQVTAYATADEYNLKSLSKGLKEQGLYKQASQHKGTLSNDSCSLSQHQIQGSNPFNSRPHIDGSKISTNLDVDEVLHMIESYHISNEPREIYFFRDGATIFWNVSEIERDNILKFLRTYESGSYEPAVVEEECESLSYSYSESKTRLVKDTVLLKTDGDTDLEKYTLSNGLSLSVKLGIWEESLEKYIEKIEYVVEELSHTGRVVLTQEQVLQRMGQLFALRHMVNLSSDLLDVPDFYWDHPNLETLFRRTCSVLSISKRTAVMNEKINHCIELMELLKSHLGEKHSARLEWIIIILIMVEVGFELLHFFI